MKKVSVISLIVVALLSLNAEARPSRLKAFQKEYPKAKGIAECILCHGETDEDLNAYGSAIADANFDFGAIEDVDSDGDSFTNKEEIKQNTYPGDPNSVPSAHITSGDYLTNEEIRDIMDFLGSN